MHSVDDVLSLVRQKVAAVPSVQVPLSEGRGCRIAEPIRLSEDSPPFDRALVDGCAVLCDASEGKLDAGTVLDVVGHLDAGAAGEEALLVRKGQAVEINTGAPLPAGADAVVMVEHTERIAGEPARVRLLRSVMRGFGLQRRGADAAAGQVVLEAGTPLSARAMAVCASAGYGEVAVRAPRAALLTTGDELVQPGTPALRPGQIRNSNHPMLRALLEEAGCSLLDLGTAGDHLELLRGHLRRGLEEADLLVVSGGMSMGTRDLVPPLLKELGVELHVEKVRMKPGKPFLFGTWQQGTRTAQVAGLPGNPVSAFVTFRRFVRPVIDALTGPPAGGAMEMATLAAELPPNGDREFYQPCRLEVEGPCAMAHPLPWRGSADLFTLARADGLLIIPAHAAAMAAGTALAVLRL